MATSTSARSWFLFAVLIASAQEISPTRTVIHGLRSTYGKGAMGRFLVNREPMEEIIRSRVGDTHDVVLASTVLPREYDTDRFTEVVIFFGNYSDTTMQGQPPSSRSEVSFRGHSVVVFLPVAIGDSQFILVVDYFTDAPAPLMVPFVTNYHSITYVDAIQDYDNRRLILHDNTDDENDDDDDDDDDDDEEDDLLEVFIEHGDSCKNNNSIGHDFDETLGGISAHVTSFPWSFDWGCDEYDFDFCKEEGYLQYRDQLRDAAGNVCTTMTTGYSNRCAATLRVEKISGSFRERMPYLVESPLSLEGEWVERTHNVGLVFPCIV